MATYSSPPPVWLSLPQAARELGVAESSIRRWIRSGELFAVKVGPGRRYRIDPADLARLRVGPDPPT
jgi:excisionase family DNA binding protein